MSDDEIRQEVWNALANDIRVDIDQISVDVANGTVFVRGTVTNLYDKRTLTEIASRLKGVLGVANEVKVVPTPKRPDEEIAEELVAALERDVWVDAEKIQTNVKDGIVRLSGRVDSYTQKYYAEGDAWSIPGVVDIINDLVIEALPVRTDVDITREVEEGLERNIRVDPDKISVAVVDGVVHLKGSVVNSEQKRLAEDVAWWTAGVTDVVDELSIQP